ncbi:MULTISPECIES: acyloxyacyl hydrolase [unclassified Novosphingobium]|uniref:acyloxyacyl hydrolase n=1 Tax=unclassified Novosphingobium TaxID=2644732 RepID=UPI0025DED329|nr:MULTISPECIES: acyloxyacyl hydrolase [unclassified Novosphingobium]HQV04558.1 acyloxyacyl hydrolase [Novosphingobium sp.]
MTATRLLAAAMGVCALTALPANAQEVYLGASFHGVNLPTSFDTGERGHDLQAGVRSEPIEALKPIGKPQAYLHGQVSLDGETSFAAAGLTWKLGKGPVYLGPALGLAIHNGKVPKFDAQGRRIDLGSRITFNPALSLGYRVNDKVAAELSWEHISHATLLSGQNPGMDSIGARVVMKLD